MFGGETTELENNLRESFKKIRDDMNKLHEEISKLREENTQLKDDNKKIIDNLGNPDYVRSIVKETISAYSPEPKNNEQKILKKIKRNRKLIIKNRILELAKLNDMSIPEVKDILVDQEDICSKATFYRYIEKLKKQKLIDIANIHERQIMVFINQRQESYNSPFNK